MKKKSNPVLKEVPSQRKLQQQQEQAVKELKIRSKTLPVIEVADVSDLSGMIYEAVSMVKIKNRYYLVSLTCQDDQILDVSIDGGNNKAGTLSRLKMKIVNEFYFKKGSK